jgi:hypothetical protein
MCGTYSISEEWWQDGLALLYLQRGSDSCSVHPFSFSSFSSFSLLRLADPVPLLVST